MPIQQANGQCMSRGQPSLNARRLIGGDQRIGELGCSGLQRRLFLGRARLKTQLVGLEVYVGVRARAVRKDLTRVGAFSGQAVFDP